jgi:DNA-binding transcriptional LysR family regulator
MPARVSLRLFTYRSFPVAAPALAETLGPGRPARLLDALLLHDSDALGWRMWFAAQGLDYRPKWQDRRFEDYNLVLDAAAHGLGMALARPPLCGKLLEEGRLVRVDRRTLADTAPYWLDRSRGRLRPAAAEMARRIAAAAGVPQAAIAGFLATRD